MNISKVFLYDEPSIPQIKIVELAEFIKKQIGVDTEVRQSFFEHFKRTEKTSYELATCRIFNPYTPFEKHMPTIEEVEAEEQNTASNIVLYDGFELQNIFRDTIPDFELSQDKFHIIFTTKLSCTYDYEDHRYHGRTIICSNPSIISTTGIIEAPAKPRDYYIQVQMRMAQGLNLDALKNEFKGRFLENNDEKLNFVVRGYAMQAVFYYLTGIPFCESKECMLHNAHWQEDLLYAQIERGKLCEKHQKILENL